MRNFRYDINGLRAWAVLAVVFFHFNLLGFTGGYAGVDVFFVISGFLMTKIITDGLLFSKNKFSLVQFYLFRARRIIPPLSFLCIILIILGYHILIGSQYRQLSIQAMAAVTFLSNFLFFRQAGYFDSLANTKWLLHTWSLSIEWQFYLILPIILFYTCKIYPRIFSIRIVVLVSALLSLLLSVVLTKYKPEFAFYMLPTRAWEMLAGGCVYLYLDNLSFKKKYSQIMEVLGFFLICTSFFVFTKDTAWPGGFAIIPVLGASLIIAAKNNSLLTNNVLVQYLGNVSYSLYLWHWPIYVFIVYYELDQNYSYVMIALMATLMCAHLSYTFIETPSRKLFRNKSDYASFAKVILFVSVFLMIPFYVYLQKGLVNPVTIKLYEITRETENKNPRELECNALQKDNPQSPPECTYGGKDIGIILLGDSHASALVLALEKALPNKRLHVLDWSILACPAMLKYTGGPEFYKKCVISNQAFLEKSRKLPRNIPLLMINYVNSNENMEFACEIAKDRAVYMLRPTPYYVSHVPNTMAQNILRKKSEVRIKMSVQNYNKEQEAYLALQDEAAKKCGIKLLETLPYFCDNGYCYGDKEGKPLYYDEHHLSLRGADLLIPEFKKIFTEHQSVS